MSDYAHVVGIDLGTTYSAIAHIDANGIPQIIPNLDNDRVTPSIVTVQGDTVLVGSIARQLAQNDPLDSIQFVKTHMGRRRKKFTLGGQAWTPEEISAMILKKLVQDAEAVLGCDRIINAVITVPAFFNEQQRKSTEDAGHIAGLNVLGIINEPTAAALAYGFNQIGKNQTVLVYDLGGGTFDITITRIEGSTIQMLATDGDVQLGGKDWDQRIVEYAVAWFIERHGVDPNRYPETMQELRQQAEQAKIHLSRIQATRLRVHCQGFRELIPLTREQFEELTFDLLAQTETTLNLVIEEAGLSFSDIDEILLVGGSTRMPGVQRMFESLIGKSPRHVMHPDECVAQGAAIHGMMTQLAKIAQGAPLPAPSLSPAALDRFRHMEERLINSHTLGIKALHPDGRTVVAPVIPRRSSVPCREARRFQTSHDGQQAVRICIMEGESENPDACTEIGTCIIQDLPPNVEKGVPIDVAFEYTRDSRVRVSAELPTLGQSAKTDIERTAGLTPDEIQGAAARLAKLVIE